MMFGFLAGFLGADPEERFTAKGKRVIALRLAVKVRQANKDETIWCKCNIWHDRYDKMLPYLKKGSAIIVGGDMTPETYMKKDGSPQVSLVVAVDSLKFSPFGKLDKGDSSVRNEMENNATGFSMEDMLSDQDITSNNEEENLVSAIGDNQGYVEDDIPF